MPIVWLQKEQQKFTVSESKNIDDVEQQTHTHI